MTLRVVYISFVRLTDKTSRDWYVDYLIENGVEVEYWDIVKLVRADYEESASKQTDYLRVLRSYSELEVRLNSPENRNTHYVILVSYAAFTIRFFRLMSKYKCEMSHIRWGAIPVRAHSIIDQISRIVRSPVSTALNLIQRAIAFATRRFKLVKPFEVVFAAGDAMLNVNQYSKKVVPINLSDYSQYLNSLRTPLILDLNENYAVFLDADIPFHPDSDLLGWKKVDPFQYYFSLNRLFGWLEKKYNLKVIIAAHPRADYRNRNPFNGRSIYSDVTPDLVKHSQFVISHSSMAQSYAVLNKKPLIFIYTDSMFVSYRDNGYLQEIFDTAEFLNSSIYNIDHISENDLAVEMIDEDRYEEYKYKFLVSRSVEFRKTEEIFLSEIRKLKMESI